MAARIDFDVRGAAETKAMLAEFQGQKLQNRTRRALRAGAKVMREGLRDEARSRGDLPKSFRKTRTRGHRNPVGVSVSPSSSLSNIFEGGADPHTIAPTKGPALANRDAGFFARGPVNHPGMAARPFIGPVFDAHEGAAKDAVGDTLFEGFR